MSTVEWQRSSFCTEGGNNCLELAPAPGGRLLVRESTAPEAVLRVGARRFAALISGVKAGEFDRTV